MIGPIKHLSSNGTGASGLIFINKKGIEATYTNKECQKSRRANPFSNKPSNKSGKPITASSMTSVEEQQC